MQAKKSLHLSQIVSSQFLQNKFEAGLSQKKIRSQDMYVDIFKCFALDHNTSNAKYLRSVLWHVLRLDFVDCRFKAIFTIKGPYSPKYRLFFLRSIA